MRMSSVELPDDNEKSLSSASTSPCPSPVSEQIQAQANRLSSSQHLLQAALQSNNTSKLTPYIILLEKPAVTPTDYILTQLDSIHTPTL